MTLKYGQRSLKVVSTGKLKLDKQYHCAEFDIYHSYGVPENHNVYNFWHIGVLNQLAADHYKESHFFMQVKKSQINQNIGRVKPPDMSSAKKNTE